MNQPKLYNVEEAAKYLKISTRTVKTYAAAGRIQAQKIARSWTFTQDALDRFIRGEKPLQTDALTALIPGLAKGLRELKARLEAEKADPEAIDRLDEILTGYVVPMETLAGMRGV